MISETKLRKIRNGSTGQCYKHILGATLYLPKVRSGENVSRSAQ